MLNDIIAQSLAPWLINEARGKYDTAQQAMDEVSERLKKGNPKLTIGQILNEN